MKKRYWILKNKDKFLKYVSGLCKQFNVFYLIDRIGLFSITLSFYGCEVDIENVIYFSKRYKKYNKIKRSLSHYNFNG